MSEAIEYLQRARELVSKAQSVHRQQSPVCGMEDELRLQSLAEGLGFIDCAIHHLEGGLEAPLIEMGKPQMQDAGGSDPGHWSLCW